MSRTFALIPAAGKSRRMGRPKLSLPLGGRTVLETVVAAVKQGGVNEILVVIGPLDHELRALAEKAGAAVLELEADTPEMRDTIERGLNWLEKRFQPAPDDGWLLLPADHPCVEGTVVQRILEAQKRSPNKSILVPTFEGRRGHPVWIGWQHIVDIKALERGLGLNAFLRRLIEDTLEIPVDAPSVLWDLDTPEDYQRLTR